MSRQLAGTAVTLLRWAIALGLMGVGLLWSLVTPLGSSVFVLGAGVLLGPVLVRESRRPFRLRPRDPEVLRREAMVAGGFVLAGLLLLVCGLALDAGGERSTGAVLVAAGFAGVGTVMAAAICRVWRSG